MSEIKINKAQDEDQKPPASDETKVSEEKSKGEGSIVTWQFKKRNYQEITNILDKLADKTRSGVMRKYVVKSRNWRVDLDLKNPLDKEVHEYLLRRKDVNHEFYLLTNKAKTDKISEEGRTLQKLMEMSIPQLMNCITDEELHSVGLMPANIDKYQLITAIMRKKKLA